MKKKIKIGLLLSVIVWMACLLIDIRMFVVCTVIGLLSMISVAFFLVLNKMVKNTNWWKNQYSSTKQFVSNSGYRDNIIRNYDIINLGSNPAHFAFFYEDVKGQSWATGSQGQDMDFEILKYYHSYLKEGGVVVIPIMPFTAISLYLKERPDYWGMSYYSKFAKILDVQQVAQLPYGRKLIRYLQFPLLFNGRAWRYLIRDIEKDTRYNLTDQSMMGMELDQNAKQWINGWMQEFRLRNLSDVTNPEWRKYYNDAVKLNRQIVEYCLERGLKPVFLCVPMTRHLSSLLPDDFYQFMIKDFIKEVNIYKIPFFDYTYDEMFNDDTLYFDSFFLNLKGRKLFTRRVLHDIGINI